MAERERRREVYVPWDTSYMDTVSGDNYHSPGCASIGGRGPKRRHYEQFDYT